MNTAEPVAPSAAGYAAEYAAQYAAAYRYEQVRPPPALAPYIECFWRLLAPSAASPDEILAADGRAGLLFQFAGRSQVASLESDARYSCEMSFIVGAHAQALRVEQVEVTPSELIGVRFAPGGCAAFGLLPGASGLLTPLSAWLAPGALRALIGRLYEGLYSPVWFAPLADHFTRALMPPLHAERVGYAVQRLARGEVSIPALAAAVNLSERQFTRVFRAQVGLSPKQFARVARLQRVLYMPILRQSQQSATLTLAQIARRYGFHDDAHLVHEFGQLAGMSPGAYFAGHYALIEQENPHDDRFLQPEAATIGG